MTGPLGLFGVVSVVLFAGVSNALPPQKLFVSVDVTPGDFPYMASVRYFGHHFCGGAIVGPRHIVTSARCFEVIEPGTSDMMMVATGSIYNNNGTNHAISKIIPHPDYDSTFGELGYDIGIIELAADIAFDENQASVNLPTNLALDGVRANFTGWGISINVPSELYSTRLRKTTVTIFRPDTCKNSDSGLGTMNGNTICSLGGDPCSTDNGNVLVYNGQLVGVGSFSGTCLSGYPHLYINVYYYLEWIKTIMKE